MALQLCYTEEEIAEVIHDPQFTEDILRDGIQAHIDDPATETLKALLTWRGKYSKLDTLILMNLLVAKHALGMNSPNLRLLTKYYENPNEQRKLHRKQYASCNRRDSALVFSFCLLIQNNLFEIKDGSAR